MDTCFRLFTVIFARNTLLLGKSYTYKRICVPYKDKIILVKPDEIVYVKSIRNHCLIYRKGEPARLTIYMNILEMETILPTVQFMRVHKCYIVAPELIEEMNRKKTRLYFCDDNPVPVGETYREQFLQWLNAVSRGPDNTTPR